MPTPDRGSHRDRERPRGNRLPPKKVTRSPKDSKAPVLLWAVRLFRMAKELRACGEEPQTGQDLLSHGEPNKLVAAYRQIPDYRQRLRFEEKMVNTNRQLGQQLKDLYMQRHAAKGDESSNGNAAGAQ